MENEQSQGMDIFKPEREMRPLRQARMSRGWTQQKLADLVGSTPLEVGRWERGASFPQAFYREALCKIFDQTEEELGIQRPANKNVSAFSWQKEEYFPSSEDLSALEDFYGRERERRRLLDRTRKRAATAIVGPRRSGKTWLAQYLVLSSPTQLGSQYCLGYIDVHTLFDLTVTSFVREVCQQFDLALTTDLPDLTDLNQGLRTLHCIPVLCIDRFELLFEKQQEFTEAFYQGLRSMTPMLVLIVLSRKSLPELFSLSQAKQEAFVNLDLTSPFSVIFEQITLRPFNRTEAQQFIEKKCKRAMLGQVEMDYFWQYGAMENEHWSPILLQEIGKILVEDRPHYNVQEATYRTVFEQRFQEMRKGLGKI